MCGQMSQHRLNNRFGKRIFYSCTCARKGEFIMKKLYFGGDIITMKQEGDDPEAVVTDGKTIIYVGDRKGADALEDSEMERIDLKGMTLMPAFIDPHSHFSQVAQSILMCDLSETRSFSDIYETLKDYMEKNSINKQGIIFASGYDHNFLKEGKHPDKTLLDRVSRWVPIYISHASGHMGVANSALLDLVGLTSNTPDPEGGKFGRNTDGTLNGYVEETPALMQILLPALPRMKMDIEKQMELAQEFYLKHGITTVQEGASNGQGVQRLIQYALSGKLQLDVVVYILENEYEQSSAVFKDYVDAYNNGVKIGGAKIILDGSPQGKSAWLSKPYEGEKEYCGYPTHEDSYVEGAVLNAVKGNYQIIAHCNGDAAAEQFLDSYEKALKQTENPNMDLRPVMIHCQTIRDDQLDRMKVLKMIPSIFIGHTYYWGDIHLKNLGHDRGSHISPAKSALERGLIYNFHQDTPVTKPDMLHSVWCAVNRITRNGQPIGQDQCISTYDALKGITIHAAYEYHEEDRKGTLEAGKNADMVILDKNPLKVDKKEIKDIRIVQTICKGTVKYQIS